MDAKTNRITLQTLIEDAQKIHAERLRDGRPLVAQYAATDANDGTKYAVTVVPYTSALDFNRGGRTIQ